MFYESVGSGLYPKRCQSNWIILRKIGMKNHLDALFWEFLDAAFPWFVAKTAIPQEIRISQLQRRPDWGVSLVTPPAEAKKTRTRDAREEMLPLFAYNEHM